MHEEAIPMQDGETGNLFGVALYQWVNIYTLLKKKSKKYVEQGKKVKKQLRMYMKVQSFDIDLI